MKKNNANNQTSNMRFITLQHALLGHLEITVAENVDIVWENIIAITSMEAA